MSFVHLHVHSEYSWLDGACITDDLVQRAVQLKMPAVAITDRNSVAGASHLWHLCIKAGIKPIIGLEIEVINDTTNGRAYSVILLAKNGDGYKNLCRLVTLAYEHDLNTPRITKNQLREHAQDLICLSFSVVGELCSLLLEDRDVEARQVSDWFYGVFGEDYYYEVQNHGLPSEAVAMNKLLNLAFETKIPVVLTNDCHYLERKDSIAIDALNCIRKGIEFNHPEAKRFACNEYYLKSSKEMKALFDFPPQLIRNTDVIADKINATDGYLPVSESNLTVAKVVELLRAYSSTLQIKFKPRSNHLTASLMGNKPAEVLEHLKNKLPDYDIMSWEEYQSWTPAGIYSSVLRSMRVNEEKVKELCNLIPPEAESLLEAMLISTDFSCLSSEDYVCGLAVEIGDRLIDTFRDSSAPLHSYAIIPKDISLPIVRDIEGNTKCQYGFKDIEKSGLISIELQS